MTAEPKALHAWSGEFGDRYTERNNASADAVAGRVRVWGDVLTRMKGALPKSILEVGPNLGMNLRALKQLGQFDTWAIEPNCPEEGDVGAVVGGIGAVCAGGPGIAGAG